MALDDVARWAAGVVPAEPEDSGWEGKDPDVPPIVVSMNRHGDIINVRVDPVWLARRQASAPQPASSRTGSRPREQRARRSTGTSRSRGDPPDEPPELVAPLTGGVR
jgi:hypothetical protein